MTLAEYLITHIGLTREKVDAIRGEARRNQVSFADRVYSSGALDEAGLLVAIGHCYGLLTVQLTGRDIGPDILDLLPESTARELKVLPFAFSEENGALCLACRNPGDPKLLDKLQQLLPGHQIQLYAAAGPVLDSAIEAHYRDRFGDVVIPRQAQAPEAPDTADTSVQTEKNAVIITGSQEADRLIGHALVAEGYTVTLADTVDEVFAELSQAKPDIVLVRDPETPGSSEAWAKIRAKAPSLKPRRFSSIARLLKTPFTDSETAALMAANLQMAVTAMAKVSGSPADGLTLMGQLVERMCRRIGLEPDSYLATITAGYLQDMAGLVFRDDPPPDRLTGCFRLMGMVDSASVYPPTILTIVRKMYLDLSELSAEQRESNAVRGGNILTAVDLYSSHFSAEEQITPGQFGLIEQHLRSQVNKLLLPDVAEALIGILKSQVVSAGANNTSRMALVLDQRKSLDHGLEGVIQAAGYDIVSTDSPDDCVAAWRREEPDVMILAVDGSVDDVTDTVQHLVKEKVSLTTTPTLLLYDHMTAEQVCQLLRLGLYDVILDGSHDVVELRLKRILSDREEQMRQRLQVLSAMGTHGTLTHMNVIDLLQSMGPSAKTMCISVTAEADQLTMYLDHGQLVFAESNDKSGPEAVYEALNWTSGVWSVEQISPVDLPEANIERPIDSILMEGCYRVDEMNRRQVLETAD